MANKEEKGRYDKRNKLNDLTGKEWLKRTKSFWESEKCKQDRDAFAHPAPFLIKDVEKLITMFTKSEMTVLDPFVGSGTTLIAAYQNNRKSIGIDLNNEYLALAKDRFEKMDVNLENTSDVNYILGNSFYVLDNIEKIDYIVTSPPYHNILKNKGNGLRNNRSDKGYRNGSRQGIEYYSNHSEDLGNQGTYQEFLRMFQKVMYKCYERLNEKKYCSIIISDFTVEKKEVGVQGDIIKLMEDIGFEFVGNIVLLQDNKPLFPFGYPYSFKLNHAHQNIINFRKS